MKKFSKLLSIVLTLSMATSFVAFAAGCNWGGPSSESGSSSHSSSSSSSSSSAPEASSPVEEDSSSSIPEEPEIPITEGVESYFEGEDAILANGAMGSISLKTDDAGAKNSTSLQNVNCNNGATLTYTVMAESDCEAGLYLSLAFGSSPVTNIFTLKVNGEDVAIPSVYNATQVTNWVTYEEYWLANVDLKAGSNKIVLTVTGGCGNYDYMKLVSEKELTLSSLVSSISLSTSYELLKTGETVTIVSDVQPSTATDKSLAWTSDNTAVATVDENGVVTAVAEGSALITAASKDGGATASIRIFVSDKAATRYEAENATLTNCQLESNGKFVGGINNDGAKVTFTVNNEGGARKALLRISTSVVVEGDKSIDCFYTVNQNGAAIDLSSGTFVARGEIGWNTESGFFTVEINLAEGENVIELCSVGTNVHTTLDWIEIL